MAVLLAGCETAPPAPPAPPGSAAPGSAAPRITDPARPADTAQRANSPSASRPVAYIAGQTVTDADLLDPLMEAAGGQVLSELVLDRMIRDRLDQRGLELSPGLIQQEKSHMLSTLSADPDEAARLLDIMRRDRGLGERRFESMLYRNAGLRLLVRDDAQVVPALVRQAYELRYGERYRVRIIVADSLTQAGALRDRALSGESFSDLAALNSTDPSAAQGGLLTPINPADSTYPKAMRQVLASMEVGEVSDLIAVDDRFIIMKLDEKLPAVPITYEDARPELERTVLLEVQGQRMQQAARSMLAEAKVVVLEPALNKSWLAQKAKARGE
jgi:parvulin-like peptidyl-prolyl isomerase